MEKTVIKRFYHNHPLILTENVYVIRAPECYGCRYPINKLEVAYVCKEWENCSSRIILHKKCGELPSEIFHPKHPDHPLTLFDYHQSLSCCDVCSRDIHWALGYQCSVCDFDVDITCPNISMDALLQEKTVLEHPCHPQHPLTLMRKSPPFRFYCDGCGVQAVDMAYICSVCEIWVHKRCALLPTVIEKSRLRHPRHLHDLALAFPIPTKHLEYASQCDVCLKSLKKTCWVYFCDYCRFFAHLRCVKFTTGENTNLEQDDDGDDDEDDDSVVKFPLHAHDISKKLITPFVKRANPIKETFHDWMASNLKRVDFLSTMLEDTTTKVDMPQTTARFSFLFNYHKHQLRLVSESSNKDGHNKMMDEEDEELKICDVCVTPISSPPYYQCVVSCKYFVHFICYKLPKSFTPFSWTHPLYGQCGTSYKSHGFKLYTSSRSKDMDTSLCRCDICGLITNGRVYECEGCKMVIDVKCASLPSTIRHASHPHHTCKLQLFKGKHCHCCGYPLKKLSYSCTRDNCRFALHLECAMLPASITAREWDRHHPLMLSSDAALDHHCEVKLHPKLWMYHSRQSDISFHLDCLKAASGGFRNIKFGRRVLFDGIHPSHPLRFSFVTVKRRCDLCHDMVFECCGFECISCYFAVCLSCGGKEITKMYSNFLH